MIFAAPEHGIRFITGITSVGEQPEPESPDSLASFAVVRVKREDETDDAWRDYGIKPIDQAFDLPDGTDRDVGLLLEVTPILGGDVQALDVSRRQYVHFPSTHGDQKPKIFLCGSATPKRLRVGVGNYNRYAVLRRVQISSSADFSNPFTEDFYFDWPGFRLPPPIPNEFLITRNSTTAGEILYIRVAHSITLQSQLSQESPILGGYPTYIYGKKIILGPWSDTLTIDWPEAKVQTGVETANGIASFNTDYSGFHTGIGLRVVHPGATEYVEEAFAISGLLDGVGIAGRVTRWVDEDSIEAGPAEQAGDLEGGFFSPTVRAIQGIPVNPSTPDVGDGLTYIDGEWVPGPLIAAPFGPAGGDLTDFYPNPTVVKLRGKEIAPIAPADGEVLIFDEATDKWTPGPMTGGEGGGSSPHLSPDVVNFNLVFDNGEASLEEGQFVDVEMPWDGEIVWWTILSGDGAGDVEFDIQIDDRTSFPPSGADSIIASAPPAISAAETGHDEMLTGWTKTFVKGDVLRAIVAAGASLNRATLALGVRWVQIPVSFNVLIDGGNAAIAEGIKARLRIPFDARIVKTSILADQEGDLVLDVWRSSHGDAPPTVADSITASAKPMLSAEIKMEDSTLTDWVVDVDAGDWLLVVAEEGATVEAATLAIDVVRR